MPTSLQWERKSNSSNNFDLILKATDHLDSLRFLKLLQLIETETHRGLSLSGRASREFRRWATQPNTPLKSDAYVLLSNWFSTTRVTVVAYWLAGARICGIFYSHTVLYGGSHHQNLVRTTQCYLLSSGIGGMLYWLLKVIRSNCRQSQQARPSTSKHEKTSVIRAQMDHPFSP